MKCPHCGCQMFRMAKGGLKLKMSTRILVLHKSGDVEANCPSCQRGVLLPLQAKPGVTEVRKALAPKLVIASLDRAQDTLS